MKIRIKDNSIRIRLAQDEVTELVKNGKVESKCQFGNNELIYGLVTADCVDITCAYVANEIIIEVPSILVENWDTDERVGFDKKTNNLYILVEKDWQCLKPRDHEDESNLYQHPAG